MNFTSNEQLQKQPDDSNFVSLDLDKDKLHEQDEERIWSLLKF